MNKKAELLLAKLLLCFFVILFLFIGLIIWTIFLSYMFGTIYRILYSWLSYHLSLLYECVEYVYIYIYIYIYSDEMIFISVIIRFFSSDFFEKFSRVHVCDAKLHNQIVFLHLSIWTTLFNCTFSHSQSIVLWLRAKCSLFISLPIPRLIVESLKLIYLKP